MVMARLLALAGTPLHDRAGEILAPPSFGQTNIVLKVAPSVTSLLWRSIARQGVTAPANTAAARTRYFMTILRLARGTFARAFSMNEGMGRSMSLQVIGAGFGRTGTMTLKTALEQLGLGPCHHMYEVILHPEQAPFWERATRGENVDWEEVFANYRSSCDWPSCAFYKELAERYPQAKVILTLRDPKAWFKSVSNTIMVSFKGPMTLPDGRRVGPPGDFAPLLIGQK